MSNVLVGVVTEDTQLAASYLDVRQIAILASLLIPLDVSFLTKQAASDAIKAVVNIAGSALVSALAIWINPSGQEVTVWLFVNTFLAAVVTSFVAYKAVWKPSGVTASIAEKSADFGLGKEVIPVNEDDDTDTHVVDDDEHVDSTVPDIGEPLEDGEAIPDDLDPGDLDAIIAAVPVESEEVK
jgi:hypothetical protein